jgi:hypothetical protein
VEPEPAVTIVTAEEASLRELGQRRVERGRRHDAVEHMAEGIGVHRLVENRSCLEYQPCAGAERAMRERDEVFNRLHANDIAAHVEPTVVAKDRCHPFDRIGHTVHGLDRGLDTLAAPQGTRSLGQEQRHAVRYRQPLKQFDFAERGRGRRRKRGKPAAGQEQLRGVRALQERLEKCTEHLGLDSARGIEVVLERIEDQEDGAPTIDVQQYLDQPRQVAAQGRPRALVGDLGPACDLHRCVEELVWANRCSRGGVEMNDVPYLALALQPVGDVIGERRFPETALADDDRAA